MAAVKQQETFTPLTTETPALVEAGVENRASFRGDDELDPTRAFVHRAVKYYDERWRWMDWSGNHRRWNWAAFLLGPVWFAYRRMKTVAASYLAWITLAVFLLALGMPAAPLVAGQLVIMIASGLYGTFLYGRRFRNEMRRAFRQSSDEEERAEILRHHGGFSYRAAAGALLVLPMIAIGTFYATDEVSAGNPSQQEGVIAPLPELEAEG